jgi:hypothetical protein
MINDLSCKGLKTKLTCDVENQLGRYFKQDALAPFSVPKTAEIR